MKILLFLILIISINSTFSQENPIDRYLSKVENIDHQDCVKSIFVEDINYNKNEDKKDHLSKKFKVIFDDHKRVLKHVSYYKDLENPFKIITYDSLNRVKHIEINREDGNGEILIQYFREDLMHPDSIKIFSLKMEERRKYINHFENQLLVRRDLIENDTLRHYTLLEYDSENHLTKELNINTENGFGVINKLGNTTTKSLYSNDSTLYLYKEVGDTIIIDRERFEDLIVREKTYKDSKVEVNIEEQIIKKRNFIFLIHKTVKSKDSTILEHKYYKDKNELKSYYNSYIYDDKIIHKWIDPIMMKEEKPEKREVTNIKTSFDEKGNWVRKIYTRNGLITNEINRTIEYFCQ